LKKKENTKILIYYKDLYQGKSVCKLSDEERENGTKRKRDLCGGER